ncbi:MAG: aminotransferase class V-fold PLP-dependent enzyme [Saprospiraceae bacterium]|nr:aminotransferase class V-fold PLP-dependent enzyme [Saprospiraceae bacterium]
MKNLLHQRMHRDLHDRSLFQNALDRGRGYLERAPDRAVYPEEQALRDLKCFDEDMPEQMSDAGEVIGLLQGYGAPATVAQMGGRYYGFVTGSVVPAGLAAKILTTFWDQNSGMYVLSPVAAALEDLVQKWLIQLFGLPAETVAGFVSGTSTANFCGLAAARYRLLKNHGWDIGQKGMYDAPRLRIVTGKHAHSTVLKAIALLGLGKEHIEWVDVDDQGRIRADRLPPLDDKTILILQAGNVNSGSFDPFEEPCRKAHEAGAWVHIDGAFGLWAAAAKDLKHLARGMEGADSWATDGHKTLNTPYDSGIVLGRDAEALVAALHMAGSYIVLSEERDGMFYTPEMSRRARIFELWATMKYLGREGIDQLVQGLHDRAVQFAEELKRIEGFDVLNEVVFNQVIACCETDELTQRTLESIQELRECWVGGSSWMGRKVIRISLCSWLTTPEDVTRSVASFERAFNKAY